MKLTALLLALAFAGPVSAQERSPEMERDVAPDTANPIETPELKAQILLDRAHFAVGEIDGNIGSTTKSAIRHYQANHGLTVSGEMDTATMAALDDGLPITRMHTLSESDVGGDFGAAPLYKDKMEKLGEIFQSSPALLKKLNLDSSFNAGDSITVPAVNGPLAAGAIAKIVVDTSDKSLMVYDSQGKLLAYYPTTLGSEESIPYGEHTTKAATKSPYYRRVLPNGKIRAMNGGPNNYVGNMWIALSQKHYGIHGSPEPSKISKQESAGCIRLTNWDAHEVAAALSKNTVVVVQE